ncbi:hypothetical protein C2845_PM03G30630 [Panicum miliaceum]|uniref:Uncharacterized protein n=1 Tax=Panicum miliaceum TaxID=4540 RepID=A0A3L6T9R9_PANMI|nr:hypothetical protein C2845_PM03G30630 [Panicum miliaceum]
MFDYRNGGRRCCGASRAAAGLPRWADPIRLHGVPGGSHGRAHLGYDIGISGGITSMDPFLVRFFPSVYRKQAEAADGSNQYCKFNS